MFWCCDCGQCVQLVGPICCFGSHCCTLHHICLSLCHAVVDKYPKHSAQNACDAVIWAVRNTENTDLGAIKVLGWVQMLIQGAIWHWKGSLELRTLIHSVIELFVRSLFNVVILTPPITAPPVQRDPPKCSPPIDLAHLE